MPGRLVPVVVGTVPAGATSITATFSGGERPARRPAADPAVTVLRTAHVVVRDQRGGFSVADADRGVGQSGVLVVRSQPLVTNFLASPY